MARMAFVLSAAFPFSQGPIRDMLPCKRVVLRRNPACWKSLDGFEIGFKVATDATLGSLPMAGLKIDFELGASKPGNA